MSTIKEILKEEGLEELEQFAGKIGVIVLKVADLLAAKNTYSAILWGALRPQAEKEIVKLVDKIDGEEG